MNLKSNFIIAIGYFYVFTAAREFYFDFIAKWDEEFYISLVTKVTLRWRKKSMLFVSKLEEVWGAKKGHYQEGGGTRR